MSGVYIFFLALVQVKLSLGLESSNVVGSIRAAPYAIPYQVLVQTEVVYENSTSRAGRCGGSLISSKFVLTAAHCIIGANSAKVITGLYSLNGIDLRRRTQIHIVDKDHLIPHENYKNPQQKSNDIGLIRLQEEIELNTAINLVNLPDDDLEIYPGLPVLFISREYVDANTHNMIPFIVKFIHLSIEDPQLCAVQYPQFDLKKNICLESYQNGGPFRGDSGSAVVHYSEGKPILVGIISYGNSKKIAAVMVNVKAFRPWITKHTS